ncbi:MULTISPECIES: hypothetical protein [Streptomyces]|uniref:hypothetical protein n=1 Tax=Streptomyces TaxID=1883 RepID=UPI0015FF05BA|nr:hypothetical protein [Streptomyces murinus]MBA9050823.1 hypothetical protein [Streptomyces murinus]
MVTRKDVGKRVTDGSRVGVLQDVDRKWVDPASLPTERRTYNLAFVRPEGGGREWTTNPNRLVLA